MYAFADNTYSCWQQQKNFAIASLDQWLCQTGADTITVLESRLLAAVLLADPKLSAAHTPHRPFIAAGRSDRNRWKGTEK